MGRRARGHAHLPLAQRLRYYRAMAIDKRKIALAALDNHARRYKVTIPDRLRAFYAGDFGRYHLQYVTAKVLSWGKGTFQLALTAPTWLDRGDDGVTGPRGDWKDAKHHVPIFASNSDLCVVVNIAKPQCPTAWYHEEECSYKGAQPGADSLDAFLASLTKTADGDDEVNAPDDPDQEMYWEQDFGDDSPRVFDVAGDD
jgi:hypothetical protein